MNTHEAVQQAKKNIEGYLKDIEDEIIALRRLHTEGISFKIFMEEDEYPEDVDSRRIERAYVWLNVDQEDQLMGVVAKMEV